MRKLTVFLLVLGCICTLPEIPGGVVYAQEPAISEGSVAIDTSKASNLGFGRLYPFSAANGTGKLYYFTTSSKKSYYQIKALVTGGSGISVKIYDKKGMPVGEQIQLENESYERIALAPSAKYYIELSGSNDAAGEIIVSEIRDDFADTAEEAKEISFGKEYAVTTECAGDVDCFKFTTGTEDVSYSVVIDSAAGIAGNYLLEDASGEPVDSGVTDAEKKITKKVSLENDKEYYLKLSSETAACKMLVTVKKTVNKYKVTYHLNSGTNAKGNPASYKADEGYILKAPTRKGYIFGGWFAGKKYGTEVTKIDGADKKAYDLYAKWVKVQPGGAQIKSLTSKSVGKVNLEYDAVPGAGGYQIRITRIVKGKKNTVNKLVQKTTMVFKDWVQGEVYYVTVRAYEIDSCGNRVYGAYSKTEKVTVKKKTVKKKAVKKTKKKA